MDTPSVFSEAVKRRRRHSLAHKREVLEACDQPGQSVAAVAQRYQINANQVHRWRRELRPSAPAKQDDFVQLPAVVPPTPALSGAITVELPSPKGPVVIHWPAGQIDHLAHWLRAVLA